MADQDFKIELKGLDQLIKALKVKPPKVHIGVLGNDARTGKGKTASNAVIGAVHEFGAPGRGIPQRSFLRVPLMNHLNDQLQKSGFLDKLTLAEVIKSGSILPWMNQVATVAEGIVDDAFETAGDGTWPAWKNPGYTNEGGMLLVDSGQLRRSITSKVDE